MDHEISRLEAIERRLGALEMLTVTTEKAGAARIPDLRLLDDLRHREGSRYEQGALRGAITLAGAATTGIGEVLWAGEHGLAEIWNLDPSNLARLLAALGHPARIVLVRALLAGERTSQELGEVVGSGSAGQLYHHLKDLMAAGIVDQAGRNQYRISKTRVVPLLVILAAAGDVARPHETEDTTLTPEIRE